MPFEKRGSTPKSPGHFTKLGELRCEQCNIPMCTLCVSTGEHLEHQLKIQEKKPNKIFRKICKN